MAARDVIVYGGKTYTIDEANTPSAGVGRDSDGSINVGVASMTGATIAGKLKVANVTKTTTFTFDDSAVVYRLDGTGGIFTGTLPPAATVSGRTYRYFKVDAANNVTVKGAGSELINASNTLVVSSQYAHGELQSNGVGWDIIG